MVADIFKRLPSTLMNSEILVTGFIPRSIYEQIRIHFQVDFILGWQLVLSVAQLEP
jgi:hypothetical protein